MLFKRYLCVLLVIAALTTMFPMTAAAAEVVNHKTGFSESSVSVSPSYATGVRLNKTSMRLLINRTGPLKVNNYKGKVTWSSSKKSVAVVNSKGVVTPKGYGTAVITAKLANGKKYTCTVRVVKKVTAAVSISSGSIIGKFANNTTRPIKKISAYLYQYDGSGDLVCEGKWTITDALPGNTILSSKVPVYSPTVMSAKIVLKTVYFQDGTYWKP